MSAFTVGLALLPLSVKFAIVSQYSGVLVERFGPRAISGLRLAYLGGAIVELAGALIALAFIRGDAIKQKAA